MKNYIKILFTIASIIYVSGSSGGYIWAHPLEGYGFGSRIGQAGAGVAVVDSWDSPWFNPAGLAAPKKKKNIQYPNRNEKSLTPSDYGGLNTDSIGISKDGSDNQSGSLTIRSIKNNQSYGNLALDDHEVPIGADPDFKPPTGAVSFGIGYLYGAANMQVRATNPNQTAKDRIASGLEGQDLGMIQLGLQIELNRWFWTPYDIPVSMGLILSMDSSGVVNEFPDLGQSHYTMRRLAPHANHIVAVFGVAAQVWKERLSIGFGTDGGAETNGKIRIDNVTLDENEPLDVNGKIDAKAKPAASLGMQYRHPWHQHEFLAGIHYRMETQLDTNLETTVVLPLDIKQVDTIAASQIKQPHRLLLGGGWRWKGYLAHFEVEWQNWSAFKLPANRVGFEEELDFNDVFIVRLAGVAPMKWNHYLRKHHVNLGGGIAYIPAYTQDTSGAANRLDNDKFVTGISGQMVLPGLTPFQRPTLLDVAFQWQHWIERQAIKQGNPVFPDKTAQPNYSYGGDLFLVQMSLTWKW